MSVLRHPIRPILRSPISSVLGQVGSLAGSATAYLAGNQPYHWFDFVNDRALYQGSDVGALSSIPGYSFSRASTGYYTNADGTLTSFASGALRRGDRGVLIEGARTNLLLRSQEFDNASWSKTGSSVTADAGTAPDGTTTADLITTSGSDLISQAVSVSSGATLAWSHIAKRDSHDWIRLTILSGADAVSGWFNLATGATGTLGVQGAGVSTSISIVPLANGYYRCIVVGSVPSATSYACIIATAASDNSFTRVNGTRYAWGAQAEAASFPSSYIPTTSASVTRAADILTLDLLNPNAYDVSGQPELVTNGGFDADTTGWTAGNSATLSVASSRMRVTGTGVANPYAYQAITTVAGRAYKITVDFTLVDVSANVWAGTSVGGSNLLSETMSSTGSYAYVFIASGTTTYLSMKLNTSASLSSDFDNISVKEIPTSQQTTYPLTLWAEFESFPTSGLAAQATLFTGSSDYSAMRNDTNLPRAFVFVGAATQAYTSGPALSGGHEKYAARFSTDNVVLAGAGTLGTADTLATMPSAPSRIDIGAVNNTQHAFGYIRRVAVFNSALNDSQLQAITA